MSEHLSALEVVNLAEVINHMFANGRIRYLSDDPDGVIRTGTLRHLCTDPEHLVGYPDDVRDAYVRVTWDSGMEGAVKLTELVAAHTQGRCAFMDRGER